MFSRAFNEQLIGVSEVLITGTHGSAFNYKFDLILSHLLEGNMGVLLLLLKPK